MYAVPHAVPGSIAVPSPHSLKVVTNFHCTGAAAIAATAASKAAGFLARNGPPLS